MSDEPKVIKPVDFEVDPKGTIDPELARHQRTVMKLIAVVAALATLALAVVFVLPALISSDVSEQPGYAQTTAPGKVPTQAAQEAQAQDEKGPPSVLDLAARDRAQELLESAVAEFESLRSNKAEMWAEEEFLQGENGIREGEKYLREQRYPESEKLLAATLEKLKALSAQLPEYIARWLEEGDLALGQGDSQAALAAFERILEIDQSHAKANIGRQRATTLDQVLALIEEGQGHEEMSELGKAKSAYQKAVGIDPYAQGAIAALERLAQQDRETRYRQAMSAGYGALEAQQFTRARSFFSDAQRLGGKTQETERALALLKTAETNYAIADSLTKADRAVANENWAAAIGHFEAALKLDKALSEAQAGRSQAKRRLALDQVLVTLLDKPARFADEKVRAEGQNRLAAARDVKAAGPRLRGQIQTLSTLITDYSTPVVGSVNSDGFTEVIILRQKRLGKFNQQSLTLLPGKHVATGTRDGHRDVRVEFDVPPRSSSFSIEVICNEVLSFGN
ncbi:MAG: hypothetical protein AAF384_17375 [Pseudomonadota bacterium]